MAIRIVMLGDIVGTPGRYAVAQAMPLIRQRYAPDAVIANAENAASGSGLTPDLYTKLCTAGVDAITLGDHVYKKKQIIGTLEREANIIRPANLPAGAAGKPWMRVPLGPPEARGSKGHLFVLTLLGRLYMGLPVDEPFAAVDRVLAVLPQKNPLVLVEVHMEATSEKVAMGHHLDGRAVAVLGTHTHIPTADAKILPKGTAYLTDLGMTGPYHSVLGRQIDRVLAHLTTAMPAPFDVAEEDPRVCGAVIDIDERSGRAVAIERLEIAADRTKPPFTAA
jgi:metallophosphoesterase (TIGR00282 family)